MYYHSLEMTAIEDNWEKCSQMQGQTDAGCSTLTLRFPGLQSHAEIFSTKLSPSTSAVRVQVCVGVGVGTGMRAPSCLHHPDHAGRGSTSFYISYNVVNYYKLPK